MNDFKTPWTTGKRCIYNSAGRIVAHCIGNSINLFHIIKCVNSEAKRRKTQAQSNVVERDLSREVHHLHKLNALPVEIAQQLGISTKKVVTILKLRPGALPWGNATRVGKSKVSWRTLRKYLRMGKTTKECAELLNCSVPTVARLRKEYHLRKKDLRSCDSTNSATPAGT